MIRGTIGPKGRPGYLVPHQHGVINLIGDRAFVVDEKADRVTDTAGEELVLTPAVFEHVRAAIRDGAPMLLEPLVGNDGPRDPMELVQELERLERLLRGAEDMIGQLTQRSDLLAADNRAAQQQLQEALKKIVELERQNIALQADLDKAKKKAQKPEAQKPEAQKPEAQKPEQSKPE